MAVESSQIGDGPIIGRRILTAKCPEGDLSQGFLITKPLSGLSISPISNGCQHRRYCLWPGYGSASYRVLNWTGSVWLSFLREYDIEIKTRTWVACFANKYIHLRWIGAGNADGVRSSADGIIRHSGVMPRTPGLTPVSAAAVGKWCVIALLWPIRSFLTILRIPVIWIWPQPGGMFPPDLCWNWHLSVNSAWSTTIYYVFLNRAMLSGGGVISFFHSGRQHESISSI